MKQPEFTTYLKAGYPLLLVKTFEESRAISRLTGKAIENNYKTFSWDIDLGLCEHVSAFSKKQIDSKCINPPYSPIVRFTSEDFCKSDALLILKDYHRFIGNGEVCRKIKNAIPALKANNKHIVFISASFEIPIDLEKDITLYDFPLPSIEELKNIAQELIKANADQDKSLNDLEITDDTLSIANGLTYQEAEDAFSLSIFKERKIDSGIVELAKLQSIKKSGILELWTPVPIEQFGGYQPLKEYIKLRKKGFEDPQYPTPKGILLTGIPGTGKSLASKVVASILNCPLFRLDFASLKSSLVGQSEDRLKRALSIIDAHGKCVVWIDEIEKFMSGAFSSGYTDGGTTASMFGMFLTWMQESTTLKYICATCNDIKIILELSQGALLRRFDDIFFLDIPSVDEKKEILEIMNKKYNTDIPLNMVFQMHGWTGAEIEKFVRNTVYEGINTAFNNMHPISEYNKDIIQKAREWAKLNARWANTVDDIVKTENSGRRINVEEK